SVVELVKPHALVPTSGVCVTGPRDHHVEGSNGYGTNESSDQRTANTPVHAAAFRVRVATVYQPMRTQKLTAAHVRIMGRLAIRASWATYAVLTSRPPAAIHRANMRFHATANQRVRRRPNSAAMWATWFLMVPE